MMAIVDARQWPRDDHLASVAPDAVVIVLGGGTDDDSLLDTFSVDRLQTAIEVVKGMPRARLITTRNASHGLNTDADQRRIVTAAGLLDRWTILDGVAHTTRDEATTLHKQQPALTSVVVVTSPMHTRRACAVFEGVGFHVTCVPSQYRNQSLYNDVEQYVYEKAAWALYRHRDWVR